MKGRRGPRSLQACRRPCDRIIVGVAHAFFIRVRGLHKVTRAPDVRMRIRLEVMSKGRDQLRILRQDRLAVPIGAQRRSWSTASILRDSLH